MFLHCKFTEEACSVRFPRSNHSVLQSGTPKDSCGITQPLQLQVEIARYILNSKAKLFSI